MMIEDYGHAIEATVSLRVVSCNEPRDVALYLVRRLRGERLGEIGRKFGAAKNFCYLP